MFQRGEPAPICHQFIPFALRQLDHELWWKSFVVSFDLTVKVLRFDSIEIGEISVDHHSLSSKQKDPIFNNIGWHQLQFFHGFPPS